MRWMIHSMKIQSVRLLFRCHRLNDTGACNYSYIQYVSALIVASWYFWVCLCCRGCCWKWIAFIIQSLIDVLLLLLPRSSRIHKNRPSCEHFIFCIFKTRQIGPFVHVHVHKFSFELPEPVSQIGSILRKFRNCIHTNFCYSWRTKPCAQNRERRMIIVWTFTENLNHTAMTETDSIFASV